jgi:hypothetical protein
MPQKGEAYHFRNRPSSFAPTVDTITCAGISRPSRIRRSTRHAHYRIRDCRLSSTHLVGAGLSSRRTFLGGFLLPPRANSVRLNLPPVLNEEGYQGREGKHAGQTGAYVHFEIE